MDHSFKEGDSVQVVDREATADDAKSGLFYNHYRNLTGVVQKPYETTEEIAVIVDEPSLSDAISTRHGEIRAAMKAKWLDGLSEEARGRLTDAEKDFRLNYSILIAPADLRLIDPAARMTTAVEKPVAVETHAIEAPRRKTSAEIDAEEEAYRLSRQTSEE